MASSEGGVVAVVMVGAVGGRGRRGRVSEGRGDGGRLDGDDPGVHDLTVHLHHHLIALGGVIEALINRHGRHHQRHFGPAGFVVADGRKQQVVPSERNHVEGVLSAVDGIQEVAVGDLWTRKNLQLTFYGAVSLDRQISGDIRLPLLSFLCDLGLLGDLGFSSRLLPVDLMSMNPTSELVCQPERLGAVELPAA